MASSERIKLLGHKAELEQRLEELETRAANHIITVRDTVDPYEDFTRIEVERAEQAMISLKALVLQARQKKEALEKIKKDLG